MNIIHLFDLFGNFVGGDLGILDGGTNEDLKDTVSNGLLLELGLPDETIHLNVLEDFLRDLVEISIGVIRLDLPDDERLGNGRGLLTLLRSISLLLKLCGGSCVIFFIIVCEWVKVVFIFILRLLLFGHFFPAVVSLLLRLLLLLFLFLAFDGSKFFVSFRGSFALAE